MEKKERVLILVLMEYALGGCTEYFASGYNILVLILVLMEYALGGLVVLLYQWTKTRLNPCFNGICSRREQKTGNPYLWGFRAC